MSAGRFDLPFGEDAAAHYREQGWAIARGAFSADEVAAINAEAAAICRGDRGDFQGLMPAQPGESDQQVLERHLCLHMPHKASPMLLDAATGPQMQDIFTAGIGPNVKGMQTMLFIKAAGKPGQAWHQDERYIPTRDRSLAACWIALDDATTENGCLWAISGSHRPGVLWPMEWHGDQRFDCAEQSYDFPYSDDDAVPLEVKAGDVVLFHGHLLHRSLPNRAATGFRRALVVHAMSAESLLPWIWPDEQTSMADLDFRDIFMIAGDDPYAYKGIEDRHHAYVRPSGEGGCAGREYRSE